MKKNKLKNLLKCGILICGISLLIFACQKDDDLLKVDDNLAKQNNGNQSHLRAKDIPLILDFVKKETNNTQQVIFDDTNVNKAKQDYRNFNFSARTTSGFGYIDTSNALVVESETVISYTFKVVTKNLTNFINYIVVENKADLEKYGYFMKYTPTTQWIESRLPLSSFSGTVDYYNENEDLQTSLTLTDGNIINFGDNEIPCPEIVFNPFGVGENQSAEDSSNQGGSSIVNEEGTDSNYNPWDTWTTGWFPTDTGSGNGTGGGGGNDDIGEEEIDEGSSGGKCCKTCEVEPGVGCNHEHHHYNYVNRTGQINLKTTPSVDNPCVHTGVVAFMINQLDFTTQQIDWLTDIEQADIYASLIDYLNLANYNQVAIDKAQDVVETLMQNDCEVNPIQEICNCLNLDFGIFICITDAINSIFDDDCSISDDAFNSIYSTNSPFNVDLSLVRASCDNDNIDLSQVESNAKFMCVYNKLAESPKFKTLFIDTFGEENSEMNVKFELVTLSNPNAAANITSDVNNPTEITIAFNKTRIDNNHPLTTASDIIHEAIHAFLRYKAHECNGDSIPALNTQNLSETLNNYNYDCSIATDQHDLMFNNLIPTMTDMLAEVLNDLVASSDMNYFHNFWWNDDITAEAENWNWLSYTDSSGTELEGCLYFMSLVGLSAAEEFENEITNDDRKGFLFDEYNVLINNKRATQTLFDHSTCDN